MKKEGGKESAARKKKKYSWLTYVLCLALAVLIWLAVMWVNPPKTETVLHNIPVTLTGAATAEREGYTCSYTATVNATFRGTRLQLSALKGKVTATVNAEGIDPACGKADLPVTFSYPEGAEAVDEVTVTVLFLKNPDAGTKD